VLQQDTVRARKVAQKSTGTNRVKHQMTRPFVHASRLAALVLTGMLVSLAAGAQSQTTTTQRTQNPVGKGSAVSGAKDAGTSEAGLRQRVEQLEEQLVDMQVVIGTLESLAKGVSSTGSANARSNPGAAAALDASDAGRLDGLETQIRAMAAQLEQLQDQVRALGSRGGSLQSSNSLANNEPQTSNRLAPAPDKGGGFGSVMVTPAPGKKDEINRILNDTEGKGGEPAEGQREASIQGGGDADPKALYGTAYGYLIQRDYGAAEAAFEDFLRQYPNDPLAGNALYWMGESLFVRGQYRAAANAFLKGYKDYAKSEKAPESLLKLAMSLQRLGQKDAACSSFNELSTKFPNAAPRVKSAAQTERQRVGC
jgi:tol-pal system protein YbgF